MLRLEIGTKQKQKNTSSYHEWSIERGGKEANTHVAVHGQPANLAQRIVLVRPNLGHVEDVPLVRLRILGLHHLHKDIPLGVVALLDSLEQVLGQEVGVFAGHLCGGLGVEVLGAALGLEVELDILEAAVLCL